MNIHHLDCWPEFFHALVDGSKTCEMRPNDRGFRVGDKLIQHCLKHNRRGASRDDSVEPFAAKITHIVQGGKFGIQPGYAMLSLLVVEDNNPNQAELPLTV